MVSITQLMSKIWIPIDNISKHIIKDNNHFSYTGNDGYFFGLPVLIVDILI